MLPACSQTAWPTPHLRPTQLLDTHYTKRHSWRTGLPQWQVTQVDPVPPATRPHHVATLQVTCFGTQQVVATTSGEMCMCACCGPSHTLILLICLVLWAESAMRISSSCSHHMQRCWMPVDRTLQHTVTKARGKGASQAFCSTIPLPHN